MVVGMSLGAGRQGGWPSTAAGMASTDRKLLVRKERLARGHPGGLSVGMPYPLRERALVFAQGGSCQFAIKESRVNVREITFQLPTGLSVEPAPGALWREQAE